jgi:hypothetical protein
MVQTTLGSRSWAAPIQYRPFCITSMGIVQGTPSSQRDRTGPQGRVNCIAGCFRFFPRSNAFKADRVRYALRTTDGFSV